MNISTFDDLLRAARSQPRPQRLLFVFAGAELPDDASPEQRARHAAGEGGALAPLMCVDKAPDELGGFAQLRDESRAFGPEWAIVFVAALDGEAGRAPTSDDAAAPLQRMVDAIKAGSFGNFIPFDRNGDALSFG